jgi:hypothetical protein
VALKAREGSGTPVPAIEILSFDSKPFAEPDERRLISCRRDNQHLGGARTECVDKREFGLVGKRHIE